MYEFEPSDPLKADRLASDPHDAPLPADELSADHEELFALATALARLQPRAATWDRDRLMFLAGQASARERLVLAPTTAELRSAAGRSWGWPAAFGAMTAVAATLLGVLLARPAGNVLPVEPAMSSLAQQSAAGPKAMRDKTSRGGDATNGDSIKNKNASPTALAALDANAWASSLPKNFRQRQMERLLRDEPALPVDSAPAAANDWEPMHKKPLSLRSWEALLEEINNTAPALHDSAG